jgi:hypothetical protein
MSKATQLKDNGSVQYKIALRDWLLQRLGGADECRVLELFGGQGVLHDACYTDAKAHLAFDLKKVNRPTWLQGDNRVLLQTRVNGWDLYDLDAYAIPWQLAYDICRMREPGVFGFALTCGMPRPFCAGTIHPFIRKKVGLGGMDFNGCGILYRYYEDIVRIMITDWQQYGVNVIEAKHMDSDTHKTAYFAMLLEKDPDTNVLSESTSLTKKSKAGKIPIPK